ncbi:hypothetical protein CaCOL14_011134 [Colletotrichum acutatum]
MENLPMFFGTPSSSSRLIRSPMPSPTSAPRSAASKPRATIPRRSSIAWLLDPPALKNGSVGNLPARGQSRKVRMSAMGNIYVLLNAKVSQCSLTVFVFWNKILKRLEDAQRPWR